MNNSENTKRWMTTNPEKTLTNKKNRKDRLDKLRKEAEAAFKKTPHKTLHKAVKAYCNNCEHGTSRSGFDYAPVECDKKKCPLYAYRNFDASRTNKTSRKTIAYARSCRKTRHLESEGV